MHVGQEVVAHTGIYVMNPDRMDRLETEGPFYAWLSPGTRISTTRTCRPTRSGSRRSRSRSTDRTGCRSARASPCRCPVGRVRGRGVQRPVHALRVREFVQGWITITRTAEEARLMNLARERKWNLRDAKKEARQLEGDLGSLEADLDAAQGEARAAALDLRSTDRTIELLGSENDALRARLAAAETDGYPCGRSWPRDRDPRGRVPGPSTARPGVRDPGHRARRSRRRGPRRRLATPSRSRSRRGGAARRTARRRRPTSRGRPDEEQVARLEHRLAPVAHLHGAAARDDEADVLDIAAFLTGRLADVLGPDPPGFVARARP